MKDGNILNVRRKNHMSWAEVYLPDCLSSVFNYLNRSHKSSMFARRSLNIWSLNFPTLTWTHLVCLQAAVLVSDWPERPRLKPQCKNMTEIWKVVVIIQMSSSTWWIKIALISCLVCLGELQFPFRVIHHLSVRFPWYYSYFASHPHSINYKPKKPWKGPRLLLVLGKALCCH